MDFQNTVVNAVTLCSGLLNLQSWTWTSRDLRAPDLFMLPYTRDFAHFKQWPHGWPQPTETKFILLLKIPPALSFSISVNGTIIYLFIQVIYITSLNKWALYLEDNLNFKCLSNNASIPTNWACPGHLLSSFTWVTTSTFLPPQFYCEVTDTRHCVSLKYTA